MARLHLFVTVSGIKYRNCQTTCRHRNKQRRLWWFGRAQLADRRR